MLFICHPKFCINIVFSFSCGHFSSQEKMKTMLMQNFGVTNKDHYGMLWYFWSGRLLPSESLCRVFRKTTLSIQHIKKPDIKRNIQATINSTINQLRSYSKDTRNIPCEPHRLSWKIARPVVVRLLSGKIQLRIGVINRMPVTTFHVRWILSSNFTRIPVQQKIAGFSPSDSSHSRE